MDGFAPEKIETARRDAARAAEDGKYVAFKNAATVAKFRMAEYQNENPMAPVDNNDLDIAAFKAQYPSIQFENNQVDKTSLVGRLHTFLTRVGSADNFYKLFKAIVPASSLIHNKITGVVYHPTKRLLAAIKQHNEHVTTPNYDKYLEPLYTSNLMTNIANSDFMFKWGDMNYGQRITALQKLADNAREDLVGQSKTSSILGVRPVALDMFLPEADVAPYRDPPPKKVYQPEKAFIEDNKDK